MTNASEEQEFKIDISELFPKFSEHLNIQNNSRILFSGKFGIGKTYFLNEFFEDKKNEYEVFHLFPINYQISSNENIIEFLKRDVLVNLLAKKEVFDNKNNLDKNFVDFIKKEWNTNSFLKSVVENSVELLPFGFDKLGKPLKTALEVDKKFQEFKQQGENKILDDFLKNQNSESDILSEIIKNKINKVKNKKKSVLVLDDLERIDPEHIFRILNVFSAHFDICNNELANKFGFDKIILVADSRNLKSIFYHKYGENTDFNGYFDKFFSVEIFQFKNEEIVTNVVDQIISEFKIEDEENLKGAIGRSGFLRIFLNDILIRSLELSGKEKLNLRQLLKGVKFPLNAFKNSTYNKRSIYGRDQAIPQYINISIEALISIFGGLSDDLLFVLKKIRLKLNSKDDRYRAHKEFSKYLLLKISPFDKSEKNLKHGWSNYSIEISNGEIIKINNKEGTELNISFLFFDLLIEYIEKKYYLEKVEQW